MSSGDGCCCCFYFVSFRERVCGPERAHNIRSNALTLHVNVENFTKSSHCDPAPPPSLPLPPRTTDDREKTIAVISTIGWRKETQKSEQSIGKTFWPKNLHKRISTNWKTALIFVAFFAFSCPLPFAARSACDCHQLDISDCNVLRKCAVFCCHSLSRHITRYGWLPRFCPQALNNGRTDNSSELMKIIHRWTRLWLASRARQATQKTRSQEQWHSSI